jgi:hypothetical protein
VKTKWHNLSPTGGLQPSLTSAAEAVEKVSEQIPGRDAKNNDLIECAMINDLMLRKG